MSKSVWKINSKIELGKSSITVNGESIPVRSIDFHQDAESVPTLTLTLIPRFIELVGDYDPEIVIPLVCPGCKCELHRLKIGREEKDDVRYIYVGCKCEVKE